MNLTVPPGRTVRADENLSDLTTSTLTGKPSWADDGVTLVIPFDREPTATERARIRLRLLTRDAAEEARFVKLLDALEAIKDDPHPYAVALRELLDMQLRRVAP